MKSRVDKLKEELKRMQLDAVLVSSQDSVEHLSGYKNFSKDERDALIFIGEDFEYIITDGRYSEAVKQISPHLELFERGGSSTTEKLLKKYKNKIKTLGIEENDLTVSEYKIVKKHFTNIKHFEVSKLRSVKEDEEIKNLKKATEIGDKAFEFILTRIKTGITEKDIAQELENFVRRQGGEFSFPAIVAIGKNSSVPHHHTGHKQLTDKDIIIMMDFGVRYENYCSDMTRTVFFGESSTRQREVYNIVLEAQKRAVEFLETRVRVAKKVTGAEVDQVARSYILSCGYPEIPHSLGHGIGLLVHEHPHISPKSKEELKNGMVFSIEPGIYLEGFGGVRIEDLFWINDKKLVQLTHSNKELMVI